MEITEQDVLTLDSRGSTVGFCLRVDAFKRLTGYEANPLLEKLAFTGHRCVVVEDADDAETFIEGGTVLRPETDMGKMPAGAGTIISVGLRFGQGPFPHPSGLEVDDPRDALGCRVIYSLHMGQTVHLDEVGAMRKQWEGKYLVMGDRDLWAVDLNPREVRKPVDEPDGA